MTTETMEAVQASGSSKKDLLRRAESVAQRYPRAVPRYTSYPPATCLRPENADGRIKDALREAYKLELPLALYLHVPFCPSLCYFCACNKIITSDRDAIAGYVDYVAKEVDLVLAAAGGKLPISEAHWGGGSPSHLPPALIDRLDRIVSALGASMPARKSIELDPRTTTREKIAVLAERSFSRVSLGVQDLDEKVQTIVNRIQSFDLLERVVVDLRDAGISSINFDLIYGLPGQTVESFESTVRRICELRPGRLAVYGYAHVQWRTKVQKVFEKHSLPTPEERREIFLTAREILLEQGYRQIGFDHFALPSDELCVAESTGSLRRNFMGYTQLDASDVVALGPSAISDIGGALFQNAVAIDGYRASLDRGSLPVCRSYYRTADDLERAQIIEGIMCHGEIPDDCLTNERFAAAWPSLERMISDGLLETRGKRLALNGIFGWMFVRQIASLFDGHLSGEHRYSEAS